MVGRQAFPFGFGLFSSAFAVSFREGTLQERDDPQLCNFGVFYMIDSMRQVLGNKNSCAKSDSPWTPWRILIHFEPKVMEVDGSDDFPDFNWVIFRFIPAVHFPGCKNQNILESSVLK